MNEEKLNTYACVINLKLYPARQASSEEEFIANLLSEYNGVCGDLFDICEADLTGILSDEEKG